MRSSGDEKKLPERHQSGTVRTDPAIVGERPQEDQAADGGPVRGDLRSAVPAQERLPVEDATQGIPKVAHSTFLLRQMKRAQSTRNQPAGGGIKKIRLARPVPDRNATP